MEASFLIIAVVVVALLFDFANGWNDSANAIATVVSTRVLSPLAAVLMAAVLNFVGAYLSTKVAKTIGGGLVNAEIVTQPVVLFAMLSATIWVALATIKGLPISASHALIGGLVGAAIGQAGSAVIIWKGLITVLIALIVSPVIGIAAGFGLMWLLKHLVANHSFSKINAVFGKLQIVSSGLMALSHGTGDAQKVMGVITLALFSGGYVKDLNVPLWVITVCAAAMALGTATGGWKVIKTLGTGLMDLRPVHGCMAETAAAGVIFASASLGVPVSTTHVITSTIVGVGAAKRRGGVRWIVGKKILYAWVLTLPFCLVLGYLFVKAFNSVAVAHLTSSF